LLAKGSIETKQEERYNTFLTAFSEYMNEYSDTTNKYYNDLKVLTVKATIALKKIAQEKTKEKQQEANNN
jgi:hypothetical protein